MRHVKASRRRGRSLFVSALALLLLFQVSAPVWAWGRLGHRVISRIAEKKLNPKAKAAIAELLDEGESIADASTWPSRSKRTKNNAKLGVAPARYIRRTQTCSYALWRRF